MSLNITQVFVIAACMVSINLSDFRPPAKQSRSR